MVMKMNNETLVRCCFCGDKNSKDESFQISRNVWACNYCHDTFDYEDETQAEVVLLNYGEINIGLWSHMGEVYE